MTVPRATYRLQFHKHFTFADAAARVRYFSDLGISHIYASPILAARAGSQHGYDVVDHNRINPELGGEDGLRAFSQTLKQHGLGLIVDIVPNHMAVGGSDNSWWLDVLENGSNSRFARTFDIDWQAPGLEGKVLAPFLDGSPKCAWERGELKLLREGAPPRWVFAYFQHRFPLRAEDQALGTEPASWSEAESLLQRQNFVLADWRQADTRINWRRFFDVTSLAALRVEEPEVFDAVHVKILALYGEEVIDGVRVDHVDGLTDPAAYCRHLRRRLTAARPDPYIIVEKILAEGEALPADWGLEGTTGYDAMNDISALQHADDGGVLERIWQEVSGRNRSFEAEENEARQEILRSKFAAQRNAAVASFSRILPEIPQQAVRQQLESSIVALRCYRGYQTGSAGSPPLSPPLRDALANAPDFQPLFESSSSDPTVMDTLRRFHQLSAPVAAKAVEDTAFYRYGRLLSRNDVGFNPRRTFLAPGEFHHRVKVRMRLFPNAMLTTATHDHKHGEDARARLAAISAQPDLWHNFIQTAPRRPDLNPGDIYMLYQTLLSVWAVRVDAAFADRIVQWGRKHLREAKLRSSWQSPDAGYEDAFCGFARHLILDADAVPFRAALTDLLAAIAPQAENNILAQVVLRNTLPGVPDLYQGAEFTDYSLVDPDNRRPVDYGARATALAQAALPHAPLDHRKQKLIALLLAARRQRPALWRQSTYAPVEMPPGLIAFQRWHDGHGLFVLTRCNSVESPARLCLPWTGKDILTGRQLTAGEHPAAFLLEHWPALVVTDDPA
ncbi:MAG: malto-oligosyltrehalose synthase [Alphaproteobacteria bacterium]|nr:malto-oligosyltrehalose synthase [Alphaproteobacteria bacterium]